MDMIAAGSVYAAGFMEWPAKQAKEQMLTSSKTKYPEAARYFKEEPAIP